MKHHLLRQKDIIPSDILIAPINIVGAGAIGSHTAIALAKMGFSDISVWDDDIVEEENMNAQGYGRHHLQLAKVEALAQIIHEYTGTEITMKPETYMGIPMPGVVISAVDNMETRKLIWESHKESPNTMIVIDPRMGAEQALMYTMNPLDPKDVIAYEKTLYTDQEALPEPCTAKATIYTALLLSGMVCKAVKDVLTHSALYPRVLNWNIKDNHYLCWGKKGSIEDKETTQGHGQLKAIA